MYLCWIVLYYYTYVCRLNRYQWQHAPNTQQRRVHWSLKTTLVHRHSRRYDRLLDTRDINKSFTLPPLLPAEISRTISGYPRATIEQVSELNHITHLRSARLRLGMNYTRRQWFSVCDKPPDCSLMNPTALRQCPNVATRYHEKDRLQRDFFHGHHHLRRLEADSRLHNSAQLHNATTARLALVVVVVAVERATHSKGGATPETYSQWHPLEIYTTRDARERRCTINFRCSLIAAIADDTLVCRPPIKHQAYSICVLHTSASGVSKPVNLCFSLLRMHHHFRFPTLVRWRYESKCHHSRELSIRVSTTAYRYRSEPQLSNEQKQRKQ